MYDEMEVIKKKVSGFYDDTLVLKVQILKSPIFYGSAPSIHEITREYLNNADVKLKISENAGRIELDFSIQ